MGPRRPPTLGSENADHDQVAGYQRAHRIAMTPGPGDASQPRQASSGNRVAVVMVGAALAARVARDARTYETALVIVRGRRGVRPREG
jgi:hypothetical protein